MDLTHVRFSGTAASPLRSGSSARVTAAAGGRASYEGPRVTGLAADVLAGAGIDPLNYRAAPLNRRTPSCARALRSGTSTDAISSLLIGFSSFFRDDDVFQTVATRVLPHLRALDRPLRVLSVGCSAGQELYSLGMLLAEQGMAERAELVGIDCRRHAIRAASEGVFPESMVSTVPAPFRARYFFPAMGGSRVVESLRSRTRFQVMDATTEIPPGPWDLVVCRNLFIYLQPRTIDLMLTRMLNHLPLLGVLIVGKAERPPATFGLKPIGRCIYSRNAF